MGRDITQCHPRLQALAQRLKEGCAAQGLIIGIGECFRSAAEQDALYAQGRTEPGNIVTNAPGSSYSSQHQWGIAFDFYRNDGQGAYNEAGDFFRRVGAVGKSLGLGWGGDWTSIVDKPHLYLPDWGSGTNILKQQYGTFERFKETWGGEEKVWEYQTIGTGSGRVEVTASSLIIRDAPGGRDTGGRYSKGERITPFKKALAGSERWFETDRGWVSADYLEGWISEGGRWWYLRPGYAYPAGGLEVIGGKCYCFDFNGWMLTQDRIQADGEVI